MFGTGYGVGSGGFSPTPYTEMLEHAEQVNVYKHYSEQVDENKRLIRKLTNARKQVAELKREARRKNTSHTPHKPSIMHKPRSIPVTATAYTAFCPSGCSGRTATGIDVSSTIYYEGKRVIAVSPSQIPLGSTVEVEVGGRTFTAKAIDTGGDIVYGRIDVLVASKSEARRFGRQSAKVRIIRRGGR